MVQFKAAPGSRSQMFNRLPQIATHVPNKVQMARSKKTKQRVLKPAEVGQSRLTTTRRSSGEQKQQIIQLPSIRLVAGYSSSNSDAGADIAAATMAGAAVLWTLGVVVLIFVIWGIVRSGQVLASNYSAAKTGGSVNDDITANPWFFGILIVATVLYLILNITGSSLAGSASDAVLNINGSSAAADQKAAVEAAQDAAGSQAAYGIASVFGVGSAIMAIVALVRLKFTKGALARHLASR